MFYGDLKQNLFHKKNSNNSGIQTNFFCQEQAGPLKQNDWESSPKLRGPGIGGKLNSLQHHCQAFALLIMS